MNNKIKYTVSEELKGMRLDKYITFLDNDISRVTAQRLLESGNITVNGKVEKASYKVSIRR